MIMITFLTACEAKTLITAMSYKALGLERHSCSFLFNKKKRNSPIPSPTEVGSILGHLS